MKLLVHARIAGQEFDPHPVAGPHFHHPRQRAEMLPVG